MVTGVHLSRLLFSENLSDITSRQRGCSGRIPEQPHHFVRAKAPHLLNAVSLDNRRRAGFDWPVCDSHIATPKRNHMTTQIQMYSRYEAAAMLGISFVTLDRLTKDGKIRTTNIGRRVLFAGNDLRSFI